MNEITKPQAEALARFLLTLRPDWSLVYTIPAVENMRLIDADVERITRAAVRGALARKAGRFVLAKPDPLAMNGEHWKARIDDPPELGPTPAIDCPRCGLTHDRRLDCVAEGWQRVTATKAERVTELLEARRLELQAIERCSHKVPRSHCAEHRKQVDA